MSSKERKPLVVCFGEVLWDIFPTYRRIGGAPLNVAYNLNKFAIEAKLITRVGQDKEGKEILKYMESIPIDTLQCQRDSYHETGVVFASFDEHNEAQYTFKEPSAWDFILFTSSDFDLVAQADAFVFGSLACRNAQSKATLLQLLEAAKYAVFDVNIRAPHYDMDFIIELLHKANLVKMNETELHLILDHLKHAYSTDLESLQFLKKTFKLDEIIVSRGDKGGIYFFENTCLHFPAVEIVIKDTVGSGDAFLAGFLAEKLKGGSPEYQVKKGAALGAFITSQAGACPEYSFDDFLYFYQTCIFEDKEIVVRSGND